MQKQKHVLLSVLMLIFSSVCFPQKDTLNINNLLNMSLEDILDMKISIASPTPQDVMLAPSNVTVINRECIEKYGFRSLAEALSHVAGIDVLQTNLDKNVVTFRGILQNYYNNKVLLMINNIPVWQAIYGNFNINRIDINDIERVEILRGPASVLYGSNAYTGAINIILNTKTESNTVNTESYYGLFSAKGISTNIITKEKDWNFMLGFNYDAEKHSPYKRKIAPSVYLDGNDTISSYPDSTMLFQEESNEISFNFVAKKGSHEFLLNAFSAGHTFLGDFISYASGAGNWFEDKGILAAYKYTKKIAPKSRFQTMASFDYFQRNFDHTPDKSKTTKLSTQRFNIKSLLHHSLSEKLSVEAGAEINFSYDHKHWHENAFTGEKIRDNFDNLPEYISEYSIFAQPIISLKKFEFTLGNRYTIRTNRSQNFSSRFTGLYKYHKNHSFKFIIAEAFRNPNLLELYVDHPAVLGNINLEPETCRSAEIIYQGRFQKVYVHVGLSQTRYKNLIQRVNIKPSTYSNISSYSGNTIEAEIKYVDSKSFRCYVNYSYAGEADFNTIYKVLSPVFFEKVKQASDTSNTYALAPKHQLSAGVNKSFKPFAIYLTLRTYSGVEGLLGSIPAQAQISGGVNFSEKIGNIVFENYIHLDNITGSQMLTPEYSRRIEGINTIAQKGYGFTIQYILRLKI